MMRNIIEFALNNVEAAARFIAELTKVGIEFSMETDNFGIKVTITGY